MMDIENILIDWHQGLSHGELIEKFLLTREQEFAITLCSDGLSVSEIKERIQNVTSKMKSSEIKSVMKKATKENNNG